jgi:hypothetical protein
MERLQRHGRLSRLSLGSTNSTSGWARALFAERPVLRRSARPRQTLSEGGSRAVSDPVCDAPERGLWRRLSRRAPVARERLSVVVATRIDALRTSMAHRLPISHDLDVHGTSVTLRHVSCTRPGTKPSQRNSRNGCHHASR